MIRYGRGSIGHPGRGSNLHKRERVEGGRVEVLGPNKRRQMHMGPGEMTARGWWVSES